jgi:hypothetical protein
VAWITNENPSGQSYINVEDGVPTGLPGSIAGLQGEDEGQANDFQLQDGTVLPQPLTDSELYGEYADAWRVSDATSLFNYGPGQSTATFTDVNFPNAPLTLADLPTALVNEAAATVAAAGITDPATAAAAELDYIATGENPAFLVGAQNAAQNGVPTTAADVTQTSSPVPALGVYAPQPKIVEAAAGSTAVDFDVFLTSAAAADTTVDYTVVDGGSGYLGAAAFGGVLPSGQITIAAGQTTGQIALALPQNILGAAPSGNLEIEISDPNGVALAAPTAQTEIDNNTPEAGAPAAPQLDYLGTQGAFTFDAATNTYELNLGGEIQGALLSSAQFAIVNGAAAPADNLSGTSPRQPVAVSP